MPIMRMLSNGGPKQFPNLAIYLDSCPKPPSGRSGLAIQIALGLVGAISVGFALLGLLIGSFTGQYVAPLIFTGFFGVSAIAMAAVHTYDRKRAPKPTDLDLRAVEIRAILQDHLNDRRLHKAAGIAVTTLLEEACRHWVRVQNALNGPFWRDPVLPAPYDDLRDKARLSADSAMQEILVELGTRIAADIGPKHWKDVVEDLLENMGFRSATPETVFPFELEAPRRTAEGLMGLANQVEQTALHGPVEMREVTSADAKLRATLGELKALNEAEGELRTSSEYRS